MTVHDGEISDTEAAGCADEFEIPHAQELSADHADQSHPAKQGEDSQQPEDVGFHDTGQDDQQKQHRQSRPDLYDALADKIDPTAEVSLQCTYQNTYHRTDDCQ